MRHRVDHRKLGRTQAHRKAMLANMVTSLFDKERIRTTDAKAKEARRSAERLITRAKKGYAAFKEHQSLKDAGKAAEAKQMQAVALAHWRQASRVVRKRPVLKKLFDEIAPQYMEREGGYTRILHLGNRLGDNAKTVILELVGSETRTEKHEGKKTKGGESASKKPAKASKAAAKKPAKPGAAAAGKPKAEPKDATATDAPPKKHKKAGGEGAEAAEDSGDQS